MVMDNLRTHMSEKVRQIIEAKGCHLLFLLPAPRISHRLWSAFSQLKAFLRRAEARTHETLQEAIIQALATIIAQDAHGWFRHCGYQSADPAMYVARSWFDLYQDR